jgi:hypothetical protein
MGMPIGGQYYVTVPSRDPSLSTRSQSVPVTSLDLYPMYL